MICARAAPTHVPKLKRQTPIRALWCTCDVCRRRAEHATQRNKQWRKQETKTKQNKKRSNKAQKGKIKTKKIYRYLLNKTKQKTYTHNPSLKKNKKKKQEEAMTAGFFLWKEVLNQTKQ